MPALTPPPSKGRGPGSRHQNVSSLGIVIYTLSAEDERNCTVMNVFKKEKPKNKRIKKD